MEALWEDMRDRFEAAEISPEMRERRARVKRGKARLLDWDSMKATIDGNNRDLSVHGR